MLALHATDVSERIEMPNHGMNSDWLKLRSFLPALYPTRYASRWTWTDDASDLRTST